MPRREETASTGVIYFRNGGQARLVWFLEELPDGWLCERIRCGNPDLPPVREFYPASEWTTKEADCAPFDPELELEDGTDV